MTHPYREPSAKVAAVRPSWWSRLRCWLSLHTETLDEDRDDLAWLDERCRFAMVCTRCGEKRTYAMGSELIIARIRARGAIKYTYDPIGQRYVDANALMAIWSTLMSHTKRS